MRPFCTLVLPRLGRDFGTPKALRKAFGEKEKAAEEAGTELVQQDPLPEGPGKVDMSEFDSINEESTGASEGEEGGNKILGMLEFIREESKKEEDAAHAACLRVVDGIKPASSPLRTAQVPPYRPARKLLRRPRRVRGEG